MYAGAPKHPIFSGSTFGLMSGDKPMYQPQVQGGHEALAQELAKLGLHYEETSGRYNEPERSYIIHGATADQMTHLGKLFGQESVIHSQNGQHKLVYTNGPNEGKYHPSQMQQPIEHFEKPPQDFYTSVPGHGFMRINFDWDKTQPMEHPQAQPPQAQPAPDSSAPIGKAERELDFEDAANLAKTAVAQLLSAQAPRYTHPHAYPWHDGHTQHHQQADLAGPQLPGLAKADAEPDYAESQRPKPGSGDFKKFSLPHGTVQPGSNPNLNFYRYEGKLPEAVKLAEDHGYKHYFAGGKYGKPDLANKNYNTGHLMVYDPGDQKGRIAHNRDYAVAYSITHELAHALTLPEVNKIYGEGRRLGKLGVHRTLHEALRAVHWEHLATAKQRELSKQIGVNLSDDDFHRDRNTVMAETVMRAVTGRFTEPNNEGFTPHARPVPLHVSLQMVRDAAHEMGLKGMHETIKKDPMQKSLPLKSPAAAGVTRAPAAQPAAPAAAPAAGAPVDHVGNFMATLKTLPREGPARGKHITQAMSNPQFIGALQTHPQGKQIHAMLTNHLNSTANAGPKAPMQVTAKSEPNLSKAEGDTVAEKTYTVEEVNEILLKTTQEKVATFAKEIESLRQRELKKALIPPHKHNQSSQASMASEDIPPGKLNPKGLDKSGEAMAMSDMCKTHGGLLSKCGCKMEKGGQDGTKIPLPTGGAEGAHADAQAKMAEVKKADLVSENGKRTENHSVKGAKDPVATKPIERGSKKDPGSGGIKLPGSKLKKNAAPPMAKPPSGKNMGTAVPTSAPKAPAMKPPAMKAEDLNMEKGVDKMVVHGDKPKAPIAGADFTASKQGDKAIYEAKKPELAKAGLPAAPKAQMAQHANIMGSKAAAPGAAPAGGVKLPGAHLQAQRASGFQAAAAGAFQPKGPINSGLELAPKAGAAPKLPGAGGPPKPASPLGLASPKAAGATRAPGAGGPPKPAPAPGMVAAKPAGAKPGIFGKLFGGK